MITLRQTAAFMVVRGAAAGASLTATAKTNTCRLNQSSTAIADPTITTPLAESSAAYKELVLRLQKITNLKHSQAVLNYDQLVFMPQSERASAARGAQLAALASVIHEKSTSTEIKELLD